MNCKYNIPDRSDCCCDNCQGNSIFSTPEQRDRMNTLNYLWREAYQYAWVVSVKTENDSTYLIVTNLSMVMAKDKIEK